MANANGTVRHHLEQSNVEAFEIPDVKRVERAGRKMDQVVVPDVRSDKPDRSIEGRELTGAVVSANQGAGAPSSRNSPGRALSTTTTLLLRQTFVVERYRRCHVPRSDTAPFRTVRDRENAHRNPRLHSKTRVQILFASERASTRDRLHSTTVRSASDYAQACDARSRS